MTSVACDGVPTAASFDGYFIRRLDGYFIRRLLHSTAVSSMALWMELLKGGTLLILIQFSTPTKHLMEQLNQLEVGMILVASILPTSMDYSTPAAGSDS